MIVPNLEPPGKPGGEWRTMERSRLVEGLNRFFSGVDPQQPLRGWGRVRWGQSYDAVRRDYPQARPENGQLHIEPSEGDQGGWRLAFAFDAGHLLQSVTLSLEGSSETSDFAAISQTLTRRLGPPKESGDGWQTWRRDDSQVTLSRDPGGGVVLEETA